MKCLINHEISYFHHRHNIILNFVIYGGIYTAVFIYSICEHINTQKKFCSVGHKISTCVEHIVYLEMQIGLVQVWALLHVSA